MKRVVSLAMWALGLAVFPALASAEDIWVVPEAPGDRELGRYLARALPGASLREDLASQGVMELSAGSPRSVLRVDLRGGVLEAARPGGVEVLRRRFDPSVGRASPFAIAVAAAELLELPEPPLPPDDPPVDSPPNTSRPEATPPDEAVTDDRTEPDRAGRNPQEAADGEELASQAARVDVESPDDSNEEAETVGEREESDEASAAPVDSAPVGGSASEPLAWSFMAGAGYALFVAPSPTTTFHRPYGELAVGFGSRRLRGYLGVVAELFGQSDVGTQAAATVTLRRHDVLGTLGLLWDVTHAVAIDVRATVGLALPSVDVSSAGTDLPGNAREALVIGLGAGARVRLISGLHVAIGAEFGIDEGAQRYLVQGEALARDGPFFARLRAGLMWDTR